MQHLKNLTQNLVLKISLVNEVVDHHILLHQNIQAHLAMIHHQENVPIQIIHQTLDHHTTIIQSPLYLATLEVHHRHHHPENHL